MDKKELVRIAYDLLELWYEAEKANLENGICFRGLTFKQLQREKAHYTRRINSFLDKGGMEAKG